MMAANLFDMQKFIVETAKLAESNEKFPIGVLAVRLTKAAQAHPHDAMLVGVAGTLMKRSAKQNFISKAELRKLANDLWSNNSKCLEILAEELGTVPMYQRPEAKELAPLNLAASDQNLVGTLTHALDPKSNPRSYAKKVAEAGEKVCLHELNTMAPPHSVEVVAGQVDLLICRADYETPKGTSSVLIPIEIKSGKPLVPNMFLTQAGLAELSKSNLEGHLVATAGQKFFVDPHKVLKVLTAAKNVEVKPVVSELDFILAKAAAAKGTAYTPEGILYSSNPINPEIKEESTRTLDSFLFGDKLNTVAGTAEVLHGRPLVLSAQSLVKNELAKMGYTQAQVKLFKAAADALSFAVSIGSSGFNVPVAVKAGQVYAPELVLANGKIFDFSNVGISCAMVQPDAQMVAMSSLMSDQRPEVLVGKVKTAAVAGNTALVEDTLNVLKHTDEVAYKQAFRDYLDVINNRSEEPMSKCSAPKQTPHSKYVICSHTNLPLHKVYQDEHGDCLPLYRKGLTPSEGATFLHTKIFWS